MINIIQNIKPKYLTVAFDVSKKTFRKDKLPCKEEIIRKFATSESEKMFKNIDTLGLCRYLISTIDNDDLPIDEIIKAEVEYYGSPTYINKDLEDNTLIILNVDTKYTPKLRAYSPISGNTETVKIAKKDFKKQPLEVGNVILVYNIYEKHKKTKDKDGKWIELEDVEFWIDDYEIIKE